LNEEGVYASQETHMWASTVCYGDSFTFSYGADVRTSQETHPWASTTSYENSFTFSHVDDLLTSQETYFWASTACYGDIFTSFFSFLLLIKCKNNIDTFLYYLVTLS
jgi:hypothetical protein